MSAILAAQEVFKIYQMGTNNVTALDNVSLEIREREFVAIQGTSGSGKSTLLNMLGGLDHPTKGEVFFASKPLGPFTKKEMARYRRFSVGMIFQNFNLIPTMSARENVSLALAFGGLRGISHLQSTSFCTPDHEHREGFVAVAPREAAPSPVDVASFPR